METNTLQDELQELDFENFEIEDIADVALHAQSVCAAAAAAAPAAPSRPQPMKGRFLPATSLRILTDFKAMHTVEIPELGTLPNISCDATEHLDDGDALCLRRRGASLL